MTAEQMRAARALLRWQQKDVAERSGISEPTIRRLEAMTGELAGHTGTIRSIRSAFEAAGVIFIPENGEGPGVRLAKQKGDTQ